MRSTEVASLFRLEVALDLREKAAWGGMLLYVVSAVYVTYLSVHRIVDLPTWNALYWVILLFAAFHALARSFIREEGGRHLYLYTLADPRSVILARTAYNALNMLALSGLSILAYILLLGSGPLADADLPQFIAVVLLGAAGLAVVLTLIAALAAKAGNGFGLMAILGFPVVLPMLLTVMRASKNALDGIAWGMNARYLLWIVAIDALVVALAWMLYPYLWRD